MQQILPSMGFSVTLGVALLFSGKSECHHYEFPLFSRTTIGRIVIN